MRQRLRFLQDFAIIISRLAFLKGCIQNTLRLIQGFAITIRRLAFLKKGCVPNTLWLIKGFAISVYWGYLRTLQLTYIVTLYAVHDEATKGQYNLCSVEVLRSLLSTGLYPRLLNFSRLIIIFLYFPVTLK